MMFPVVFFSRIAAFSQRIVLKTPATMLALTGIVFLAAGCADSSGSESGASVNNESQSPGTALRTSSFETSALCPNGGILLELGFDTNRNDVLDEEEVQQTQEVCNGAHGTDGTDGTDGDDGTNGLNVLVNISEESPGSADCAFGGVKVESGLDANGNGVLEALEVNAGQTQFICNGEDGDDGEDNSDPGLTSLVETTIEPAGANCATGGIRIDSGIDANGDDVLQESEKAAPVYVCNGTGGTPGSSSLVELTVEDPGLNCPYGGTRVDTGLDADNNGSLAAEEISQTRFVCEPQSCDWTDNDDGTTTISCEGEEDRLVLNPDALGFTSRTSCGISIDHPDAGGSLIPLIYTADAIGNDLKFVSLTVLDGAQQTSSSRLIPSTVNNANEFLYGAISVYFDTFEEPTLGSYQVFLNEAANELVVGYNDSEVPGGAIYYGFPAFDDDEDDGVCTRVLAVGD